MAREWPQQQMGKTEIVVGLDHDKFGVKSVQEGDFS